MMDSESESEDSEFILSHSEDDNSDLSSDNIYSESSESEDDGMSSVRMWFEEKTVRPAPPRFNFTENPGILVNFSSDNLIQYFEYFFDDSMLQLIVDETNIYAEQCLHSKNSKNNSKQQEWRSTYKEEEVLPLEEPTVIALYDKDGRVNSRVVVTLLTAGHCLGSVMFYIEGNDGNVLYTGDFRLPIGSCARLTNLHDEKGCLKPLKSLYIDTTFCNSRCLYIPSREECLNAIISIAEPWLSKGPSYIVNIACPYEYGYEFVFVGLFKKFGMKTHVKEEKRRMYIGIKDIEDAVTSYASEARIHACALDRENLFRKSSYPFTTPCGFISPDEKPVKIIKIKPSAMFFETNYFTEISFFNKKMEMHRVCYSTHSSLTEIRDMVNYLKAEQVYPNVVANQTVEQIMCLLHSPTESEKSSLSPLGKLKSPPVHDFSSYENDSLPFFDECYEISKGENSKIDASKKGSHALKKLEDVSVDTDFDNTEEQETMLKEEIYLQKEKVEKDSTLGHSPLKWHNPIISSDEEVFGNSSLDSPLKDRSDSDDAQGTSEEIIANCFLEEENRKIADFSSPKSSASSTDLNSPSQSLIGNHCSKYMSNNHNILLEQKSKLQMKSMEKEERNNAKESCSTKKCDDGKDLGKSPFNISFNSTNEMNGHLKNGDKKNVSNLSSHVSFPHSDSNFNVSVEQSKSNTDYKASVNVELSAHGVSSEEKMHIQEHKNERKCEPCVDMKTSLRDISESKIHILGVDKPSTTSKKHNSKSYSFIKKIDSSSDSEDEYSFKYVIKLHDKNKLNNHNNTNFPHLDMNRLNGNNSSNYRISRESSNPPDFTKSHVDLNVTLCNSSFNDVVDRRKIEEETKESMSEIHCKEENFVDSAHPHMNEFKSEMLERNESVKKSDSKIQLHSQHIRSASSNVILKLDANKSSHIQNITQESVCENIKVSCAMPSSPISKITVSEMTLSKPLNKDQNSQEFVCKKDNFSSYSETTVSKSHNLHQNFDKHLSIETIPQSINAHSLNFVPSCDQNFTSFEKEQNFRGMYDKKDLCARKTKSPTSKVVDLSSDEEISVIGQMTAEKEPLTVKCEQSVTGISEQETMHKNKNLSQVLDLSSDDSNDEISIINEETTSKEKIPSAVIDLASDDSNDVLILKEKLTTHCKVLSPVQNFYAHGTSCPQNTSYSKSLLNPVVVTSNCVNKIESSFVKFKRNMSLREERCHLYNENRSKMQRTGEDQFISKVADSENRAGIMNCSNSNRSSVYGAKSGQSPNNSSVCNNLKNNTFMELNLSCQKSIEENVNIAQEIKSVKQISPTSVITVEDINSSSDLDDSPSLLAPSFMVNKGPHSSNSAIVHSTSYHEKWKTKCINDFSLSKSEFCDKLSNKICDRYMKDSDSTPEDLI